MSVVHGVRGSERRHGAVRRAILQRLSLRRGVGSGRLPVRVRTYFYYQYQRRHKYRPSKHIFSVLSFEEYEDDDNNSDNLPSPFISFTAGNGDVVTLLLSMLTGLVRRFQERDRDDRDFLVPVVVGVRLIDVCCR